MAYTKTTWVDNVTPISATNMNNLETQHEKALADAIASIVPVAIVGSYIGDGTDARAIAIGFTPSVVHVWATRTIDGVYMPSGVLLGTNSGGVRYDSGGSAANNTQLGLKMASDGSNGGIIINGFKTGVGTLFNVSAVTYYWIAWR